MILTCSGERRGRRTVQRPPAAGAAPGSSRAAAAAARDDASTGSVGSPALALATLARRAGGPRGRAAALACPAGGAESCAHVCSGHALSATGGASGPLRLQRSAPPPAGTPGSLASVCLSGSSGVSMGMDKMPIAYPRVLGAHGWLAILGRLGVPVLEAG
ncbi:unnamed protein product [Prorocentrum cordatum]|uniref:Uncharacterized protein n=1 Tax=Prorocentrum cordatum TaxID=2364126 RepID=A0ABN9WUP7_9DINO|nr:unnamed protein product [Polarella glacialis]